MIFAVGYIEGGHHGIPINDNWIGFVVFTAIGLFFGILTFVIYNKYKKKFLYWI